MSPAETHQSFLLSLMFLCYSSPKTLTEEKLIIQVLCWGLISIRVNEQEESTKSYQCPMKAQTCCSPACAGETPSILCLRMCTSSLSPRISFPLWLRPGSLALSFKAFFYLWAVFAIMIPHPDIPQIYLKYLELVNAC